MQGRAARFYVIIRDETANEAFYCACGALYFKIAPYHTLLSNELINEIFSETDL